MGHGNRSRRSCLLQFKRENKTTTGSSGEESCKGCDVRVVECPEPGCKSTHAPTFPHHSRKPCPGAAAQPPPRIHSHRRFRYDGQTIREKWSSARRGNGEPIHDLDRPSPLPPRPLLPSTSWDSFPIIPTSLPPINTTTHTIQGTGLIVHQLLHLGQGVIGLGVALEINGIVLPAVISGIRADQNSMILEVKGRTVVIRAQDEGVRYRLTLNTS